LKQTQLDEALDFQKYTGFKKPLQVSNKSFQKWLFKKPHKSFLSFQKTLAISTRNPCTKL